jgi:uncharacterized protein (TIGR02453 family)
MGGMVRGPGSTSKTARPSGATSMPAARKPAAPRPAATSFSGIPVAALDFYDDLEADNSKVFWEAHRDVYLESVRAPMLSLLSALEDEFGPGKLFRPYRDVLFSHDKTPYKTHQGAFIGVAPSTGWYVELSAAGVFVAGGFYRASPQGLAAVRTAIDGPDGGELERITASLHRAALPIGGETVRTTPRGYAADHPRIGLLRHKSITAGRSYGFEPSIHTAALLDRVRKDWRRLRPLIDWCAARLQGTAEAGR